MEYTNVLKQLREENNLTQKDLANILQISRGLYSQFEIAEKIIPLKYLEQISLHFNLSIDYLLGISKNKNYVTLKKLTRETLNFRLKEFRKENNLSQKKLAQELNTSHSVISAYESGQTLILTSFLYDICKKYHVSADYLLGKSDNPKYLK